MSARSRSICDTDAKSRFPRASAGTATARSPASVAPISYVGYAIAGYSTVSRSGVRKCRYCGVVATNSFVPIHAATHDVGTSTPNRRAIHRAAERRNASLPMLAGYPRSAPE